MYAVLVWYEDKTVETDEGEYLEQGRPRVMDTWMATAAMTNEVAERYRTRGEDVNGNKFRQVFVAEFRDQIVLPLRQAA